MTSKIAYIFFLLVVTFAAANALSAPTFFALLKWTHVRDFLKESHDKNYVDDKNYHRMKNIVEDRIEMIGTHSSLSPEDLEEEIKNYMNKFEKRSFNTEELHEAVLHAERKPMAHEPNILIKAIGMLTFINMVWFFAICLILIAMTSLFGIYVLPIAAQMPMELIEVCCWSVTFGFLYFGFCFQTTVGLFVSITGCLGIIPCYGLTLSLHSSSKGNPETACSFLFFILTIVWGFTTIIHQSQLLGYMTVMSIHGLLGFVFISTPFCYMIGFNSESAVGRGMGAGFVMMSLYSYSKIVKIDLPHLEHFENGVLFCGTFVYFLGWLIISNKWYSLNSKDTFGYLMRNAGAFTSCVVFIYLGSVLPSLSYFQKIGGTFAALLCIEKYAEINWQNGSIVWSSLIFGIILYGFSLYAHSHPEYFLFI